MECLKAKFIINSSDRSVPQKVWKETLQRLFEAGIKTFPSVGNIERHFWNNIYPNLGDVPDVDQDTLDRLMYANLLQLKRVTVVMKADGVDNKIDDDIFSEAVEIVKYKLLDVFSLQRLNILKNLSRNEYHINVDDPRLNLTIRVKAGLLRSGEDVSFIEENLNDEQIPEPIASELAVVEPASSIKSNRFAHFEEKGSSKVFTVSQGYNVVMVEKEGVKQFIAIPESQPISLPIEYSEKKDNRNLQPLSPISKSIFDPPAASTQISPIKPITPKKILTFNSPEQHLEESFNLLSVSQNSNVSKDMNEVAHESFRVETVLQKQSQSETSSVINAFVPSSQQTDIQIINQAEQFVPPIHLNPTNMDVEAALNNAQQQPENTVLSKATNQVEHESFRVETPHQTISQTETSSVINAFLPSSQRTDIQNMNQSEQPVHFNPVNMDIEPTLNVTQQQPQNTDTKMRRDIHRITQACRSMYPMFFGESTKTPDDSIENEEMEYTETESAANDSQNSAFSQPLLKYKLYRF